MIGAPDIRVSIYDHAGNLLQGDVSSDFSGGQIQYENTPSGCGAATLTLGLNYENVFYRGYYTVRNLVEVSVGDDTLQASISGGATKLYVTGTAGYDTSVGHDTGQIYLLDGSTLTMRIPVTGVGSDGGGPYITVGAPLGGGSIPAYASGTLIGRRRYCGRIIRRHLPNQWLPQAQVTCESLLQRLDRAFGTFTYAASASIDAGSAAYAALNQFFQVGRLPEYTLASFPSVGSTYAGSRGDSSVYRMCQDIVSSISSGDRWSLYVGHDRKIQLIKLYTASSQTYANTLWLAQGTADFEPVSVVNDDQDGGGMWNSVKVIGDQDPATKQPVTAIAQDSSSISIYGQDDAQPVANLSIKTTTQAANAAAALLNQNSAPKSNAQFRVYTGPYPNVTSRPMGLDNGDIVLGVHAVALTRFEAMGGQGKNLVPDSEIQYGAGSPLSLMWTSVGGTITAVSGGPGGANRFKYVGTGSASSGYVYGQQINVQPGQKLTISGYIDATNVTSVGGGVGFNWSLFSADRTQLIARAVSTVGAGGQTYSATGTVPAGVHQVVALADTNGAVVSNGNLVYWAHPQIEIGSSATSYTANYSPGNLYGLVSSAQTTIIPGGYRYQDVRFSAIEPDWTSIMAQRANAMQTAILANQLQAPGLDQYFVSSDAWPSAGPSSTGLVVSPPPFQAVFALGTQPVVVGNTFTLPAWSTTWVWVSPSNTWTLRGDTSFVAGSILYGIFQTNASAVIGSTFKASIGALKQPLSYLLSGSSFTPTFSGISITTELTGSVSSQLKIVFTATNQPTDGSLSKMRCWYRQSGQATWLLLGDDIPRDNSATPGAALSVAGPFSTNGTYLFRFPDAANGLTYEFGCSLESGSSRETSIVSLGTNASPAVDIVGLTQLTQGNVLNNYTPSSVQNLPTSIPNAATFVIPGTSSNSYFVTVSIYCIFLLLGSGGSDTITSTLGVQSGSVSNFASTQLSYESSSVTGPLQPLIASFAASGGQSVVVKMNFNGSNSLPAGVQQTTVVLQGQGTRTT